VVAEKPDRQWLDREPELAPRRLGRELEETLVHAERVLEAVDRADWRYRVLRVLQVVSLAVGLLGVGLLVVIVTQGYYFQTLWVAFSVLLAAVAGAVLTLQRTVVAVARQRDRDLAVMVQMSRTVRELLPAVAEDENWTELRHAMTRARISRFPISERSR
jgi:hypothetical protein